MTPPGLSLGAWGLLGNLVAHAGRGLVLAGTTALALAALRVRRAAIRLCAWTIVLYAALAMPLLGWLLPGLRWSLPNSVSARLATPAAAVLAITPPVSPSAFAPTVSAPATPVDSITGDSAAAPPTSPDSLPAATSWHSLQRGSVTARATTRPFPWDTMALAIYLAGLLTLLLRAGLGWVVTLRLERNAIPADDLEVLKRLCFQANASDVKHIPRLAEAEPLLVPLTLSVLNPVILLPAGWRTWDTAKLNAVLAHELSHAARGDAFTQRLSLLYRAAFWFSPLSWWLHHCLAELAEQASDEAALSAGADQTQYAETLLGFFTEIHSDFPAAARRVRWQALAMARGSGAERRVERILGWDEGTSAQLTKTAALGMALIAAPVILLTASVRPAIRSPLSSGAQSVQAPATHPTPTAGLAVLTQSPAPDQPKTPIKASPCTLAAVAQCQPMDVSQLAWLSAYDGKLARDVIYDSHYLQLIQEAVPDAIFHYGEDMPLADAIQSVLDDSDVPFTLRDGRYAVLSSRREITTRGRGLLWIDFQQGVAFGAIFFHPNNGEPTPTLTVFSKELGGTITKETQLPAAFLQDLNHWEIEKAIPPSTTSYLINAFGWKSVLMHDSDACKKASATSPHHPAYAKR